MAQTSTGIVASGYQSITSTCAVRGKHSCSCPTSCHTAYVAVSLSAKWQTACCALLCIEPDGFKYQKDLHADLKKHWLLCRLLEILLKHCPGMTEAHLLLADSHHLAGASQVALRKVADVLHRVPDNLPAHLLLTRIYLHQVTYPGLTYAASQEPLMQCLHLKETKA